MGQEGIKRKQWIGCLLGINGKKLERPGVTVTKERGTGSTKGLLRCNGDTFAWNLCNIHTKK